MGQGVSQPGGSDRPTPAPGGAGVGAFNAEVPFAGESAHISAVVHPPSNGEPPLAVLVCWPGGSYSRAYWDMHVPGYSGYSFAEHLGALGFTVVAADPLGVGESAKPANVDDVTLETMAGAAAEFVRALRAELGAGDVPAVAVGHSLGGCLAIVEQARHGSYDAIANLGFTHGSKESIQSAPTQGDDALAVAVEQARGFFGGDWDAGYSLTPRAENHFWLYRPDVPAEIIAADDREASAWPRQSYVGALLRGHSATYAARVKCPVFVGFGDHDVPERPHDDVGFYSASHDVTLMVLSDSAHCHNFAGTRHQLWDRLADWAGAFSRGARATR